MTVHQLSAVAFEENLTLREVAPAWPGARLTVRELHVALPGGGEVFIYPFGAVVFHDVPGAAREEQLRVLHRARPGLTTQVVRETFTVREEPGARVGLEDGVLVLDSFGPNRVAVVALIVAQSAAMEYYERIVTGLFARMTRLVDGLEKNGNVSLRTRPLHRFIGQAIATRSEVISVLTLLDKPDATWEDPVLDRIYDDLRSEFDLVDRHGALEQKLHGVQDTLELVLDVARDRKMWLLEVSIAVMIVFEVALELWRRT